MENDIEIRNIKKRLLKAARGKRSQQQISQKLGYNFNQLYRWESDLTRIHWKEFVKLCEICKVDLKSILKSTVFYKGDLTRSDLFVQFLLGTEKIASLARHLKVSRFTLSDWSKGRSEPTLDGILTLLENRDLLQNLIESFPGMTDHQDIQEKVKSKKKTRNFLYENPMAGAILISMDLKSYQKAPRYIPGSFGKYTGLSLDEEKKLLQEMEQVGLIARDGHRFVKKELNYNTQGDFESEKKLREYWVSQGLQADGRRESRSEKEYFGFLIFPVDAKKRQMVSKAYIDFANTLYNIGALDNSGDEDLMVMTMQMFGVREQNRN